MCEPRQNYVQNCKNHNIMLYVCCPYAGKKHNMFSKLCYTRFSVKIVLKRI